MRMRTGFPPSLRSANSALHGPSGPAPTGYPKPHATPITSMDSVMLALGSLTAPVSDRLSDGHTEAERSKPIRSQDNIFRGLGGSRGGGGCRGRRSGRCSSTRPSQSRAWLQEWSSTWRQRAAPTFRSAQHSCRPPTWPRSDREQPYPALSRWNTPGSERTFRPTVPRAGTSGVAQIGRRRIMCGEATSKCR